IACGEYATDDSGIDAELPLPETVADDGSRCATWRREVACDEIAAKRGSSSEHAEIVCIDEKRVLRTRLTAKVDRQREKRFGAHGGNARQIAAHRGERDERHRRGRAVPTRTRKGEYAGGCRDP